MNMTELFQFDFKTVGYGSVFFVRFDLILLFDPIFWFFAHPYLWVRNKERQQQKKYKGVNFIEEAKYLTWIPNMVTTKSIGK
jgi:hypothetical protein